MKSTNQSARPHTGIRASRRLVVSIMGPENSGKTAISLSLPQPIAVFDVDPNTELTVLKAFAVDSLDDLDPAVCQYHGTLYPVVGLGVPEATVQEEAREAWFAIEDGIRDIYEGKVSPMPRSVVIDSGTMLDRLNKLREWGRTDKIPPKERMVKLGALNKDFAGLFDMMARVGVHVAVTHRTSPHYEDIEVQTRNGPELQNKLVPGEYDRLGYKEIGNLTNCEVLSLKDVGRGGKVSNKFGFRVLQTRHRPAVIGNEYWGRTEEGVSMCSFPFLGTLLYPGTSLEEWQ